MGLPWKCAGVLYCVINRSVLFKLFGLFWSCFRMMAVHFVSLKKIQNRVGYFFRSSVFLHLHQYRKRIPTLITFSIMKPQVYVSYWTAGESSPKQVFKWVCCCCFSSGRHAQHVQHTTSLLLRSWGILGNWECWCWNGQCSAVRENCHFWTTRIMQAGENPLSPRGRQKQTNKQKQKQQPALGSNKKLQNKRKKERKITLFPSLSYGPL